MFFPIVDDGRLELGRVILRSFAFVARVGGDDELKEDGRGGVGTSLCVAFRTGLAEVAEVE
jgi:hypothetical protein